MVHSDRTTNRSYLNSYFIPSGNEYLIIKGIVHNWGTVVKNDKKEENKNGQSFWKEGPHPALNLVKVHCVGITLPVVTVGIHFMTCGIH